MSNSIHLLRNKFVRVILISNLFSQFGIWIRNMAVLLYVMESSNGDALAVSMIAVAEYAPIFIFSFIGGVFADRWRPKRTVVWCEGLSALSVLIVFFLIESGSWTVVFFAALISSILSQFAQPSGMKLFKLHVKDEEAPICMSLLQMFFSVFMIIGPILGTLVYQQTGIGVSILLTSVSFLISAFVMLFIPADPPVPSDQSAEPASLLREMADGIRYVIFNRELLRLSLCFTLVGLGVGLVTPLSIFLVTDRLGLPAHDLPWITIPYGLGEMLGGAAAFAVAPRIAPQRLLLMGLLVNGLGILLIGLSSVLWVTMAAQFIIALLQPAIFIGNNTLVMNHTEQAFIGRVTGIRTPLMTGSMLLMMSASGVLKDAWSLAIVYELAGLCFLAGLLFIVPIHRSRSQ
ncbi:MFS transporter [Paenibacillus sepulcri]|uniref:MFS transporter n=1 Tax=Paenibacillus sepulcri TaxID=359917 RepID=A0ABS7C1H9_9BACL|nr:MFS transporter [Paenibacillus sepulcri]